MLSSKTFSHHYGIYGLNTNGSQKEAIIKNRKGFCDLLKAQLEQCQGKTLCKPSEFFIVSVLDITRQLQKHQYIKFD